MKDQTLIVTGYDDIYRVHRWAVKCFGNYTTNIVKGWNGLGSFAVMPLGRKHAQMYRDDEIDKFEMVLSKISTDVTVLRVIHEEYDKYNDGKVESGESTRAERLI